MSFFASINGYNEKFINIFENKFNDENEFKDVDFCDKCEDEKNLFDFSTEKSFFDEPDLYESDNSFGFLQEG